ncbi:hypothetical protein M3Y94_00511400 [Aphelenchoides besseyi]|nr:hypothetical protein M3Y94_00511400 [Aphelenchoides besseyi]
MEHVPSFLSLPSPLPFQYDSYCFDTNGRFVYVQQKMESDKCEVFIVYDIIFNSYVRLTADSSFVNFESGKFKFVEENVWSILPVDSQTIIAVMIEISTPSVLLALIRFDFANKTYGVVDTHLYSYCAKPILARDDETFVMFCSSTCKDGRVVVGNRRGARSLRVGDVHD